MSIENYKKMITDNIFYEYNSDEIFKRNAVDFHAMTSDHTEILGQFLDYTGMDIEQLKECLLNGYFIMVTGMFRKK